MKKFCFSFKNNCKIANRRIQLYTPGNIRLSMGLYRTPSETEKYIQKSLKRKLP